MRKRIAALVIIGGIAAGAGTATLLSGDISTTPTTQETVEMNEIPNYTDQVESTEEQATQPEYVQVEPIPTYTPAKPSDFK